MAYSDHYRGGSRISGKGVHIYLFILFIYLYNLLVIILYEQRCVCGGGEGRFADFILFF